MSFEEKINADLKAAMLAKDEAATRSIRAIKAAILLEKTAPGGEKNLDGDGVIKLVTKMVKQRKDSIEIFEKQNRADLAQKEIEELNVLQKYLPEQLSAADLEAALKKIIADTGASGPKDMGKVMGAANKTLAGKADGKAIAESVKKLLPPA